jgi:hypothetical protein
MPLPHAHPIPAVRSRLQPRAHGPRRWRDPVLWLIACEMAVYLALLGYFVWQILRAA